jgi:hypothetical protein
MQYVGNRRKATTRLPSERTVYTQRWVTATGRKDPALARFPVSVPTLQGIAQNNAVAKQFILPNSC